MTQYPARSCFSHIVYRLHCWPTSILYALWKIRPLCTPVYRSFFPLLSLQRGRKKERNVSVTPNTPFESENIREFPIRWPVDESYSIGSAGDICSEPRVAKLFNARRSFLLSDRRRACIVVGTGGLYALTRPATRSLRSSGEYSPPTWNARRFKEYSLEFIQRSGPSRRAPKRFFCRHGICHRVLKTPWPRVRRAEGQGVGNLNPARKITLQ